MPGPGMELIGEEEIQEVLEVLRSGYLYRYDVAPGETSFQAHRLIEACGLEAVIIRGGIEDWASIIDSDLLHY